MKSLILFLILLSVPMIAKAEKCSTERTIIKKLSPDGVELVSEESRQVCKENNKDVFSDCEMYQWRHNWGKGTSVSCNWTEKQAMQAALDHAPDGLKVEWYDNSKGAKGYTVVSWTRPLSNQGWCRDIEMVKHHRSYLDKNTYIMCFSEGRGWQSFSGH